jgi:hypothetical protein
MKKSFDIEIPTVPAFITVRVDDKLQSLSLADFTEEEICEIGKEWTHKLVLAAREKRNKKYPPRKPLHKSPAGTVLE